MKNLKAVLLIVVLIYINGNIFGQTLSHKAGYFTMYPYNASYDDGTYAKLFYDGKNRIINFWNSDNNSPTRIQTGGLSISSSNQVASTHGFNNMIQFLNKNHGGIVFNPGGINELMFGMHENGKFYWGTGRSSSRPDFYPMELHATTGRLNLNGSMTAQNVSASLNHAKGYLTLQPFDSSYDDGTYAKLFYSGKNRVINFWNSDNNSPTRIKTGGLSISSSNPVSSTYGFHNMIEFVGKPFGAIVFNPGATNELMFGMHQNGNFYWATGKSSTHNPNKYMMHLNSHSGNLGIRGKLTSSEVKVKIGGWADYVFAEDYQLPTLQEVAQHIQEKGHLINIPSAAEVEKNGIQLGAMNAKLLEKIEELTLYTLEQEEKLKKMEVLEAKNKALEARLEKIEMLLQKK